MPIKAADKFRTAMGEQFGVHLEPKERMPRERPPLIVMDCIGRGALACECSPSRYRPMFPEHELRKQGIPNWEVSKYLAPMCDSCFLLHTQKKSEWCRRRARVIGRTYRVAMLQRDEATASMYGVMEHTLYHYMELKASMLAHVRSFELVIGYRLEGTAYVPAGYVPSGVITYIDASCLKYDGRITVYVWEDWAPEERVEEES